MTDDLYNDDSTADLLDRLARRDAEIARLRNEIALRDADLWLLRDEIVKLTRDARIWNIPFRPPGRYRDTDGMVGTIGRPEIIGGLAFQVLHGDTVERVEADGLMEMFTARTLSVNDAQRLVLLELTADWGCVRFRA